jgi:hypothetical protein
MLLDETPQGIGKGNDLQQHNWDNKHDRIKIASLQLFWNLEVRVTIARLPV